MKSNEKQIRLWIGGMTCVHCHTGRYAGEMDY